MYNIYGSWLYVYIIKGYEYPVRDMVGRRAWHTTHSLRRRSYLRRIYIIH